jgi:hypothetical protein
MAAAELDQLQARPDQPLGQAQVGGVVVTVGGAEGEVPFLQVDQVGVFRLGDDPDRGAVGIDQVQAAAGAQQRGQVGDDGVLGVTYTVWRSESVASHGNVLSSTGLSDETWRSSWAVGGSGHPGSRKLGGKGTKTRYRRSISRPGSGAKPCSARSWFACSATTPVGTTEPLAVD